MAVLSPRDQYLMMRLHYLIFESWDCLNGLDQVMFAWYTLHCTYKPLSSLFWPSRIPYEKGRQASIILIQWMNKIYLQKVKGHAQNLATRKRQNQNLDLDFLLKLLYFLHRVKTLFIYPMQTTTIIPLGTARVSHGKCHSKILTFYSQPLIFLLLSKIERRSPCWPLDMT